MTNTTNPTAPSDTLDANDPRSHLAASVSVAGIALAGIRDDQLSLPTPCSEYDVETLARHTVAVLRRVAAIGRGEDWTTTPQVAVDVEPSDFSPAWREAAAATHDAWADPAKLEAIHTLPFGQLPGAPALAVYTAELTIHAWDIGKATGQTLAFDDTATAIGLEAVMFGIPAEGRGPEMPFDPVVPISDDAPAIERLVAWVGRQP